MWGLFLFASYVGGTLYLFILLFKTGEGVYGLVGIIMLVGLVGLLGHIFRDGIGGRRKTIRYDSLLTFTPPLKTSPTGSQELKRGIGQQSERCSQRFKEWKKEHPDSTPEQRTDAIFEIVRDSILKEGDKEEGSRVCIQGNPLRECRAEEIDKTQQVLERQRKESEPLSPEQMDRLVKEARRVLDDQEAYRKRLKETEDQESHPAPQNESANQEEKRYQPLSPEEKDGVVRAARGYMGSLRQFQKAQASSMTTTVTGKYDRLSREELLKSMKERYGNVINTEHLADKSLIEKLENLDRWVESGKQKPDE